MDMNKRNERLRALLAEWEELKSSGDATSRDKKRALAGAFIQALPGLIEENERLRAALVGMHSKQVPQWGKPDYDRAIEEALNAKG